MKKQGNVGLSWKTAVLYALKFETNLNEIHTAQTVLVISVGMLQYSENIRIQYYT